MAAFRSASVLTRRLFSPLLCKIRFDLQYTDRKMYSTYHPGPVGGNFKEMFRNSAFARMGRPKGKIVAGRITHVVSYDGKKDLYVDFGWKFHAVVTLKQHEARDYAVNDLVKIKVIALEATGHFLGQSKRITLCEADVELEGKLETVTDVGQVCKDKTDSDGDSQAAKE